MTPFLRWPLLTTTQTMLQTGTASTGRMSFDRSRRGISARGPNVAPAHWSAVEVGDDPRRTLVLAEPPHRLLAVALAEFLDVLGPQAVRQAPAVVVPAVGVDDVGEVLEALRRQRVALPTHAPSKHRPRTRAPGRPGIGGGPQTSSKPGSENHSSVCFWLRQDPDL